MYKLSAQFVRCGTVREAVSMVYFFRYALPFYLRIFLCANHSCDKIDLLWRMSTWITLIQLSKGSMDPFVQRSFGCW